MFNNKSADRGKTCGHVSSGLRFAVPDANDGTVTDSETQTKNNRTESPQLELMNQDSQAEIQEMRKIEANTADAAESLLGIEEALRLFVDPAP